MAAGSVAVGVGVREGVPVGEGKGVPEPLGVREGLGLPVGRPVPLAVGVHTLTITVVSRGDLEMCAFLLRDARVDAALGSRVAAHPALYAAMAGNLDMLALFASHPAKLLPADDAALEQMLYATAAANGQKAALEYVQNYYIDSRPLGKLTPGRQLVKIRREFNKIDADGNGFCDEGEVRELFRALGECPRPAARVPRMRQEAQRTAKRGDAVLVNDGLGFSQLIGAGRTAECELVCTGDLLRWVITHFLLHT
jgi:hypothetical protein